MPNAAIDKKRRNDWHDVVWIKKEMRPWNNMRTFSFNDFWDVINYIHSIQSWIAVLKTINDSIDVIYLHRIMSIWILNMRGNVCSRTLREQMHFWYPSTGQQKRATEY